MEEARHHGQTPLTPEYRVTKNQQKKQEPKPKPKAAKGPFNANMHEVLADTLSLGPVDVERQCGVIIKEGVQCARSLTCKSHSMGAKRAVPGRSLPYDMLLAAYQKKNQAKQQSMTPPFLGYAALTNQQRLPSTPMLRSKMRRKPMVHLTQTKNFKASWPVLPIGTLNPLSFLNPACRFNECTKRPPSTNNYARQLTASRSTSSRSEAMAIKSSRRDILVYSLR